jgi:hypothetical protein
MRKNAPDRFIIIFATLFVMTSLAGADEVKFNPHSDSGDCTICHVVSADKLKSWFAFGSTKREMKDDLNRLCQKCHTVQINTPLGGLGVGAGHATGKKPAINHQNFPLAPDGTITCATTCHDMHVQTKDQHQQRKHLRVSAKSLCIECHEK